MTSYNVPIIWIMGGPGSGKGSQCAKIAAKYDFSHFSTGDLLRAEVAAGTDKGDELSEIMKRGDLVPNEDVLVLLEKAMQNVQRTTKGYLVDGYPREKSQGPAFEQNIAPVDMIVFLECRAEILLERILRRGRKSEDKREDDNEETARNRIATFTRNAGDILEAYAGKTKRINGDRTIDEVFADVSTELDKLLASKFPATTVN